MSEVSMRHTVKNHVDKLGSLAHWQRFEDGSPLGIPDINICIRRVEAWVEAKQMDLEDLPKRATTPVRIGLRPEQALWLRNRKLAGGNAYVLAKIGHEWLCWDDYFEELRDGMILDVMRTRCCGYAFRKFQLAMLPCFRAILPHEAGISLTYPSDPGERLLR